jgi:hypothetical protein
VESQKTSRSSSYRGAHSWHPWVDKKLMRFLKAPSWSWASVDGPIDAWPMDSGEIVQSFIDVIDANVVPLGDDPFG